MAYAEAFGLRTSDLEAQVTFLRGRAQWHREQHDSQMQLHQLCAATLLRDSAAIATLLDKFELARQLLAEAGARYLENDVTYGMVLERLAGVEKADADIYENVQDYVDGQLDAKKSESHARRRAQKFVDLVSVFQALNITKNRSEESAGLQLDVRRILDASPTMTVGPTETPLPVYLSIIDSFDTDSTETGRFPSALESDLFSVERDLFAISIQREEALRLAKADTYHWEQVLNPAAIIDFDITLLAVAELIKRGSTKSLDAAFADRGTAVSFPLIVAKGLASQ